MYKKAVILAGGKGTRLKPFTNIIPKPLLPVGDKPIILRIIEHLKNYGILDIYISVNYKKELIMNYLKDGKTIGVNIKYIEEDSETGTAGFLKLIDFDDDLFISINGDVLCDINVEELYSFHINGQFDMVLTAYKYRVKIDYGILEVKSGNLLETWYEKPKYEFLVNTGIYSISRKVIDFAKEWIKDDFIDMPDFWKIMMDRNYKIGVYIHEGIWKDIGRKDDYLNLMYHQRG